MTYGMIGGAVALVLLLWTRWAWSRHSVVKKAHEDYARCRGTLHARQLHAGIAAHEVALQRLVITSEQLAIALDSLKRTELNDLRQALTHDLVMGPLADIRGIGSKLRNRIVETCFDGTLESLSMAHQVPGVGSETAEQIREWIRHMGNRMPQLLKGEFDGKQEIQDSYDQQRRELMTRRLRIDDTIRRRRDVLAQAKRKLAALESTTPAVYCLALQGDERAAERVAAHTQGAFPEWELPPDWFAELISAPDCESYDA